MFFDINPHSGVPVFEQVANQITFAIADGALRPGEMIPSVRQLARNLAINPNTVARAYRQLQDDQIVESIRGTGIQVAQNAVSRCSNARTRIIRDRLASVIDEARQGQLEDSEIRKLVDEVLSVGRKGGN